MKKLLTALGCAMALVALPASAITLSMTPSTQQTTVGGSASVDVVVSGLSAAGEIVSGWDINIGFDPAVLGNASVTFNDAPFGGVDFLGFDNVSTPGDVAAEGLSFLLDADLGLLQGDSLTLFSVSFEGLSDGFSLLSFGADPLFERNVVGQVFQRVARGDRDAVHALHAADVEVLIAHLAEGLLREFLVPALDLLQAEHIRTDLLHEGRDQGFGAQAHGVHIPGGDRQLGHPRIDPSGQSML